MKEERYTRTKIAEVTLIDKSYISQLKERLEEIENKIDTKNNEAK